MGKYLAVAALFVFLAGSALADEADDLAKEIGSDLRAAERSMMGGKKEEAAEMWLAISEKIKKLEGLNSRHRQLRSLQSKADKLKRDLEKRLGRSIEPGAEEEMPYVMGTRLASVNSSLEDAEKSLSASPPDLSQARFHFSGAERFWKSLQKDFADEIAKGWPEVDATAKRYEEVKARLEKAEADAAGAEAAAGDAEARKEAQSEEWLKRFEPFFPGSSPNKRFDGTSSPDPEQLEKLKANWEEAKALLDEFDKTEFPAGMNYRLEQKAKELREMVDEFPKKQQEALARIVESSTRDLLEKVEWLEAPAQQEWRESEKVKPSTVSDKEMAEFEASVESAAKILGADHPRVAELRKILAGLRKENEERKRVAAARTFMSPDRWKGGDREAIEDVARQIVAKEFPKAKILKIAILRTDWSDEVETNPKLPGGHPEKVEYTRCVQTQVAVKREDGEVYLLGVWVGKTRYDEELPWGELHGNTMYCEWMLEKNLKTD